jgi:hypothetical protein
MVVTSLVVLRLVARTQQDDMRMENGSGTNNMLDITTLSTRKAPGVALCAR